jgi:WD40 repeat protein
MHQTRSTFALSLVLLLLLSGLGIADDEIIESGSASSVTGRIGPGPEKPVVPASPHLLRLEKVAQSGFSPDGKVLMTTGEVDKQVHFWSVDTGEEVNRFGVAVSNAIFCANSSRMLTWGEDGVTRIFDTRSGKALRHLEGAGAILCAGALAPDGSRALTCATDESIAKLWDTATAKVIGTLEARTGPVTGLAFSPDGKQAVVLSGELPGAATQPVTKPHTPTIRLFDVETLKERKSIVLAYPARLPTFSINGKLLLMLANNKAEIHDLSSGQEIAGPRTPEENFPAGVLSPDRKTGLSKAIGSASIINPQNNQPIRALEGSIDGMPICNQFSSDGARVIFGTGKVGLFSRNPNEPGKVYVYDAATGKRLSAFDGHAREVMQVSLSADATHAFSRDADKVLFLWAIK